MSFDHFPFVPELSRSIQDLGYKEPTSIQSQVIPSILEGKDVRGLAPTGTGKTAAFLLPTLHKMTKPLEKKPSGPRALILVPTRELGMQIATQGNKYSKYLPKVKIVCIAGGVPYHKQLPKLKRPYDILVATPGRLIDLMRQKKIRLREIELLILDEADMMLDMGFMPSVEEILAQVPEKKQTLLFSATFDKRVKSLSEKIMKNPIDVKVERSIKEPAHIEQKLYYATDRSHKNTLLTRLLEDPTREHTIIFTATKVYADQLALELSEKGYKAKALHGDMHQRKRTKTIETMRKGQIEILVATDVASRGIDIQSITHVINYDLPRNPEDYVHRIGRTGRAGAKGIALSFAFDREKHLVKKIQELTSQTLLTEVIAGLEPKPAKKRKKHGHKRSSFSHKRDRHPKKFVHSKKKRR